MDFFYNVKVDGISWDFFVCIFFSVDDGLKYESRK